MTKISKNIKKFRKQNGLTQEQLAEQMHLTRQAISNWENDKSQPDIESVAQLAEIFNVSVEEMIYGSLSKVGVKESNTGKINTMKIVLSAFGGLFCAAGVIILFVAFWKDFSQDVKALLSFLPLCIALVFAAFVYFKKLSNNVWREIAGIVWCVGSVATVLLANNSINAFETNLIFYRIDIRWLLCAALCIPALFILKSISALPVTFYFQLALCAGYIREDYGLFRSLDDYNLIMSEEEYLNRQLCERYAVLLLVAATTVLLALGLVYMLLARRSGDEVRYKISLWLCSIDFAALLAEMCEAYDWLDSNRFAYMILAFASYCLISERGRGYTLPFRVLGAVGLSVTAIMSGSLLLSNRSLAIYPLERYIIILVSLLVALSVVYAIPAFKKIASRLPIYFASIAAAVIIFAFSAGMLTESAAQLILTIVAAVIGVAFIIKGVQQLEQFELNVGITTVFAAFMRLSYELFEEHLFMLGSLLVAFGVALFFANFLMSKKKKAAA